MRMGLSLSGGGFRASFFHIGVLAQLAMKGLLGHVEVISTVSGGSIIGALYYLHLRNKLQTKPDTQITDKDYIEIVEKIEKDFLHSVQRNLRMMTYVDAKKNWQMRQPNYSQSDRLGELYDEYFYRSVVDAGSDEMIQMKDIKILPMQEDGRQAQIFDPREQNTDRRVKVPVLLINATVLNNGHVWRFEAATMGEHWVQNDDVDKNFRLLRPPSYEAMRKPHAMDESLENFELGIAVAASACVPGVFHPLAISDLYTDVRVQLVDGGVFDNQGIQGLLDNSCNYMIISDGSGQLKDEEHPNTWFAAVLSRSLEVYMKRVREEQLSRVLNDPNLSVAFFHLRECLAPRFPHVRRVKRKPGEPFGSKVPASSSQCNGFGVPAKVQDLLSRIRTDLDSFTDLEAYSLMLDGYMVSEWVLSQNPRFQGLSQSPQGQYPARWKFMKIEPWLKEPTQQYLKHLKVAESSFFKIFRLNTPLAAGTIAFLGVFVWYLIFKSPLATARIAINVRAALLLVLVAVAGIFLPRMTKSFRVLSRFQRPMRRFISLLGEAILPILGSPLVRFHLKFIDPLFIRAGKLENLHPPKKG